MMAVYDGSIGSGNSDGSLPQCSEGEVLKVVEGNWACVSGTSSCSVVTTDYVSFSSAGSGGRNLGEHDFCSLQYVDDDSPAGACYVQKVGDSGYGYSGTTSRGDQNCGGACFDLVCI